MSRLIEIKENEKYYPFQSRVENRYSKENLCVIGRRVFLRDVGTVTPIIEVIFDPHQKNHSLYRLAVDIKYSDHYKNQYYDLLVLAYLPNNTIFVSQRDNLEVEDELEAASFNLWKPLSNIYDPAVPDVITTPEETKNMALAIIRQPNQR